MVLSAILFSQLCSFVIVQSDFLFQLSENTVNNNKTKQNNTNDNKSDQ